MDFIHPAPGSRVTSPFGTRKHPITGVKSFHQGIDYAKTGNVPILASASGTVRQYISDKTTYGNVLFIEHNINGKRMDTTYAHLKSKTVKAGDKVKQGQIIGYMGNTGGSTGQHLHFEVHNGPWLSGQPNAVNPALYVDKESEEDKMLKELEKKFDELNKKVAVLSNQVDSMKENGTEEVADWAKADAEWAIKNGITEDGSRPAAKVTRQEVWRMIHSLYKLLKK